MEGQQQETVCNDLDKKEAISNLVTHICKVSQAEKFDFNDMKVIFGAVEEFFYQNARL